MIISEEKIEEIRAAAEPLGIAVETFGSESPGYDVGTHNVFTTDAPRLHTSIRLIMPDGTEDICNHPDEAMDTIAIFAEKLQR